MSTFFHSDEPPNELTQGAAKAPGALLRPLLGGILALAVAIGIGRFAYTPILPAMQRAAHLDTAQAGLLASANYAGYLVGALLAAVVPYGVTRNRILRACLVAVVVTTGLMAGTTSIVAWGSIRFFCGLTSAAVFVVASGLILDLLRRAGAASLSGWFYGGVGLGIALSGLVVHVADGPLGWRGDWLALCLCAALLMAPAWRWLPAAPPTSTTAAQDQPIRGRRVQAALALLLMAYLLDGVGYIVTGTFLVAIVDRMPGLGGAGPSVWIVVGLAAAPSSVLWSQLAARVGFAPALVLAYVAQACGIALPVFSGGAGFALAAAILFGGTFLGITTLTLTMGGQITPRRSAGIIGLLTAAFGLGQIVGPALAGILAGHAHSFGPALLAASAVVFAGGLLMAALQPLDPSRHGQPA